MRQKVVLSICGSCSYLIHPLYLSLSLCYTDAHKHTHLLLNMSFLIKSFFCPFHHRLIPCPLAFSVLFAPLLPLPLLFYFTSSSFWIFSFIPLCYLFILIPSFTAHLFCPCYAILFLSCFPVPQFLILLILILSSSLFPLSVFFMLSFSVIVSITQTLLFFSFFSIFLYSSKLVKTSKNQHKYDHNI